MEIVPEAIAVITGTFLSGRHQFPRLDGILRGGELIDEKGTLMSLYTITMPVLVQTSVSTPLLLQQWARIFDRGHVQGPVLAIMTSVTYGYATWLRVQRGENGISCTIAAVLTLSIVPYTWVFMGKINRALFKAVDDSRKEDMVVDERVAESLVISWSKLHAVRSMLPLVGAVVGLLGMLQYR